MTASERTKGRINHANERACYWLAEANAEVERGRAGSRRHLMCERRAQRWLDRLNTLEGLS